MIIIKLMDTLKIISFFIYCKLFLFKETDWELLQHNNKYYNKLIGENKHWSIRLGNSQKKK